MKEQALVQTLSESRGKGLSVRLRFICIVCIAIAAILLIGGVLGVYSQRVYQAYLVNFAFWTGLAQAGVAFAAVYRMTNAGWSDSFRRIGELFAAFLPVSFLLLLFVLLIQTHLYPWAGDPDVKNPVWLNSTFFTLRLLIYFSLLTALSLYYVGVSVRPDVGFLRANGGYEEAGGLAEKIIDRLSRNWKGFGEEYRDSAAKLRIMTPVFLIAYGVIYTFVGFDLLMTLDPDWYSTLYGWLFIVSGFYSGVVAIMVWGYFVRTRTDFGEVIDNRKFHDIGKLMLGFCMFTGGLVFSQYLTIWYGNIPKETSYIIVRFHEEPWALVSTLILLFAYFIPLIFLFSRKIKQTPWALVSLGVMVLFALWLNRYIEVVPSIWDEAYIPLGLIELGITLGFIAAVVCTWMWAARIVPMVPAKPD